MPHPAAHRRLVVIVAALAGAAATAIAIAGAVGGTACATVAGAEGAADLRITSLPGVDLSPVAGLPGVAASSGPFPAVETSIGQGRGERSVRLEARPALDGWRRMTVATVSGPREMRVAGGARRVAYVLPADLERVAPNASVHGSTLLLRLDDPSRSGRLAAWLERAYPGPQVRVTRMPRDRCAGAG